MNILAAAQETGSANALVPVVLVLQGWPGVRVTVAARAEAAEVFRSAGISLSTHADVRRLLGEAAPDVMLLGTSLGPSLEKSLLRLGEARRVPAVSVVDHWSHYRERFLDVSGPVPFPAVIAVPDAFAQQEATQAGLPPERLLVAGQPHLESLARSLPGPELQRVARSLRRAWQGGTSSARVVLFLSEVWEFDGRTETDLFNEVLRAVQRVRHATGCDVNVVAKLHPAEGAQSRLAASLPARVRLVRDDPAWPCVLAADAVVGMESMLLMEAAVAGRPVVSVKPATSEPPFIGVRLGLVDAAHTVEELVRWLRDCLLATASPVRSGLSPVASVLQRGDAAGRLARATVELGSAALAASEAFA